MLEVVFNESAGGSLKVAQSYGKGQRPAGHIGVIITYKDGRQPTREEIEAAQKQAEEKARQDWEEGIPIGGTPQDVYCFSLAFSMGDISEQLPGQKRQEALERLYSIYPGNDLHQMVQEQIRSTRENLQSLCRRAAAGEAIRIWYSDQPEEQCGLCWLMDCLENAQALKGPVYAVKLPEYECRDDGVVQQKNNFGEVSPGEWGKYLPLEKQLPRVQCLCYAFRWRELKKENAPLRAVLNGKLVSVPETIYDSFICREIEAAQEEFFEAEIIGSVLGKYALGIGDSWVALRIEQMISEGKLEAVTTPAEGRPIYHRILRKCRK